MKKLIALIVLLMTISTGFSQTTVTSTSTNTSASNVSTHTLNRIYADSTLNLKPKTIEIGGVTYKAFTVPQTNVLIKELATLEYLDGLYDNQNKIISEFEVLEDTRKKQLDTFVQIVGNNEQQMTNYLDIIQAKNNIILNKDQIINRQNATIRKQNRTIGMFGVITIGALVYFLAR